MLADRRRRQRGSVLSAVLIMVAFLAIISGALMTELSTNFLLSSDLVNRVNTEATVNSAMEVALSQLQATQLNAACPGSSSVPLNGQRAAVSVVSCFPVVDQRSLPAFRVIASSGPFTVDGSHVNVLGQEEYLVGDSAGNVLAYPFGLASPSWSISLGGSVTGPPLAMADGGSNISTLVPVSNPSNSQGVTPGCGPAAACVALLSEDIPPTSPRVQLFCFMPGAGTIIAGPAAGKAFPGLVYFGDTNGKLYAYSAGENGSCSLNASQAVLNNQAVIAGPVVMQNGSRDEIYIVTARGGSSQLLHYTYRTGSLSLSDEVGLPAPNAVGLAVEGTAAPARLAITFSSGTVSIVQVDSSFDPTVTRTSSVGSSITNAPYWCTQCPGGNLVGVGGTNGVLYVLDTNLNLVASFAGGSRISTTPAADAAGDWYIAADDGHVYEVQRPASGTSMGLAATFGSAIAPITSSPLLGSCTAGICVYLASRDGNAYIIPIDARDAVLTACMSTSPPACSGQNPRLWTHVQLGVAGNAQTVHVQGWSYYSP